MGKIGSWLYSSWGPTEKSADFISLVENLGFSPSFIIEAGVHDGSDSLKFLQMKEVINLIGFEPDTFAREIALKKLANETKKVIVREEGLSDSNSEVELFFSKNLGVASGSSTIVNGSSLNGDSIKIKLTALDDILPKICCASDPLNCPHTGESCGLLWLDVEGNALNALKGMKKTLSKIGIAKVEVEFAKAPPLWFHSNAIKIQALMLTQGLVCYSSFLQPAIRGDMVFVRLSKTKIQPRIYLRILIHLFVVPLLHGIIYPAKRLLNRRSNSRLHR